MRTTEREKETPRTDEFHVVRIPGYREGEVEQCLNFARTLERELAEAREEIAIITARAEAWEKTCQLEVERYGQLHGRLTTAEKERDEALARVTELKAENAQLFHTKNFQQLIEENAS